MKYIKYKFLADWDIEEVFELRKAMDFHLEMSKKAVFVKHDAKNRES
jgi:hypothetical protein